MMDDSELKKELDDWEFVMLTFQYTGLNPTKKELIDGTLEQIRYLKEKFTNEPKSDKRNCLRKLHVNWCDTQKKWVIQSRCVDLNNSEGERT